MSGEKGERKIWIIRDPDDQIAAQQPVCRALEYLEKSLSDHGIPIGYGEYPCEGSSDETCILISGYDSKPGNALIAEAGAPLPESPESISIIPGKLDGRNVLAVYGCDVLGLVYAIRELADQIIHSEDPMAALTPGEPTFDQPKTPIRSVTRLFTSNVEDRSWFHDKAFWHEYLSMLVGERFNRFSLALGLGYNFPRDVHDGYFYFPYPFLLAVPGYKVHVPGLSDAERDGNMESLEFISRETAAYGLHFQLALWTHAYEWIDSPDANYVVEGLTPETHAAYCRDAIKILLETCPDISGVTFRVHGESGIPEGSYGFWDTVFEGISGCGRRIEIDMHPKGIDKKMIDTALATGMPVNLSPKYAAEHMGLPYQQASIRKLERPSRENADNDFMALSGGTRRFLRYNFGDLLTENRRYGVLYRIWPGTQRFLLWGDPAFAAGFARYGTFCGSLGVELFEPLSFKGRMGSGIPGGRDGYADDSLRPSVYDWEKYLYTYRLFGRLLYNPDTRPEVWRRFLNGEFGPAAVSIEGALSNASRILPLLTTAHHPSASNNAYWPEVYTNMPIVDDARAHPYGDTLSPKRFGAVSPLDPELFSSIDEFVGEVVTGRLSGRYSPLDVADWLDGFCDTAGRHLAEAMEKTTNIHDASFRQIMVDVNIQIGIGRFFALKLRAGVQYGLFEQAHDVEALKQAVQMYRSARDTWAQMAGDAKSVYVPDLSYGLTPHLRGHWSDRVAAIDDDINDMKRVLAELDGSSVSVSQSSQKANTFLSSILREPLILQCEHTAPGSFQPGASIKIVASTNEANGRSLRLHYRHVNQAEEYVAVDMEKKEGRYSAVIPGSYTDSLFPLQYFLTVHDSHGRAGIFPGFNTTLSNQPYFLIRAGRSDET